MYRNTYLFLCRMYFSSVLTGSDSYCRGVEHAAAEVDKDLNYVRTRIVVVRTLSRFDPDCCGFRPPSPRSSCMGPLRS